MRKMRLSLILSLLLTLSGSAAWAQQPLVGAGTRELRLGSNAAILNMYSPGFANYSPEHGSSTTIMSIGIGLGYFASDNVEVGGGVGYFSISEGGSIDGPGANGFLRLYHLAQRMGLFVEPAVEFLHLSGGGNSTEVFGLGADAGLEFFVTDSWALRVSPSYRYYTSSEENSGSVTKIGVGWGISAYF